MGLFDGPQTPPEKRHDQARQAVSSAVARLVADEHGAAGFETRDLYPGAGDIWRGQHPTPGPHLEAVMALRAAVAQEERRAIDNARGAGMTWDQIGEALGLARDAQDVDEPLALAAWRYAAMRAMPGAPDPDSAWRYGRGPTADWRCRECTGTIHETHPDNGPVDAEQGHRPGCARYAAVVAEVQARWDDEDDWADDNHDTDTDEDDGGADQNRDSDTDEA
jgi:hypothetical protein